MELSGIMQSFFGSVAAIFAVTWFLTFAYKKTDVTDSLLTIYLILASIAIGFLGFWQFASSGTLGVPVGVFAGYFAYSTIIKRFPAGEAFLSGAIVAIFALLGCGVSFFIF